METPRYVVLDKLRGQTPLEAIEHWKEANPEFADIPASYAGRLDPMASGKLLVMLGEECKRKDVYIGLDKEYLITVVFDLSTDTGDTLGIASHSGTVTHATEADIMAAFRKLTGPHLVPYPAFSSKTVNGIPLFLYALRGKLDEIVIPEHVETIYKAEVLKLEQVSKHALLERIGSGLQVVPTSDEPSKLHGRDFRQHEIREQWKTMFAEMPERNFSVLTLRVTCASGTYMRSLAARLAREFGTTAIALSIERTKIGRYRKIGSFGFWAKLFR